MRTSGGSDRSSCQTARFLCESDSCSNRHSLHSTTGAPLAPRFLATSAAECFGGSRFGPHSSSPGSVGTRVVLVR